MAKKEKKVTNEQLLKKIEELQKQVEAQKYLVPFVPYTIGGTMGGNNLVQIGGSHLA